jgi:hypothetical protein
MASTTIDVLHEKVKNQEREIGDLKVHVDSEFNCVRGEINAVEDKLTSDNGIFDRLTSLEINFAKMSYPLRITDAVIMILIAAMCGRLFNLI